jgi:hypothetical protein
MMGVIQAMSAVSSGVPMGASHAIGHQLGPLGVGHGETSCILLPAVCKWNARVGANFERQEHARKILLSSQVVRDVLVKHSGQGDCEFRLLHFPSTEVSWEGRPPVSRDTNLAAWESPWGLI